MSATVARPASSAGDGRTRALSSPRVQLALYFALAFSLSWWPWPFVLLNPNSVAMIPFGPIIAAFVVTALAGGRAALGALLRSLVRWRVAPGLYAAALLLPLGSVTGAAIATTLLGGPAMGDAHLAEWYLVLLGLPGTTLLAGPLAEELGWRGFALPRLMRGRSPLAAAVIVGLIWALWHLPLLLSDPTGQRPPVPFTLLVIAQSIVLAWLYNRSRGSLFLVLLAHGIVNSVAAFVMPTYFGSHYLLFWLIFAALWWVAALAIVWRSGRDLGVQAATQS